MMLLKLVFKHFVNTAFTRCINSFAVAILLIVNRGKWSGSLANVKGANKDVKI